VAITIFGATAVVKVENLHYDFIQKETHYRLTRWFWVGIEDVLSQLFFNIQRRKMMT